MKKPYLHQLKKTGKAIIIHEDTITAGFGAEIAARVTENCFEYLDGPVKRNCWKGCIYSVSS